MGRVIDLPLLRNRRRVFRDRWHAGRVLADMLELEAERWPRPLLLAIPAGGVPVALAVHQALKWPLELAVVSKITPAWNSELGYGAVAWDGTVLLNERLVEQLGIGMDEMEEDIRRATEKVKRRLALLRGDRPWPDLQQHSVLLVDDGLATGSTLRAAIAVLKSAGVARLGIAVPTGHAEAVWRLAREVDTVYCPNIREESPYAVAEAYREWQDLTEDQVQALLARYTASAS